MKRRIYLPLLALLFAGTIWSCTDPENTDIENDFAPLKGLSVPDYYQFAQGQTIEITGRGFSSLDSVVMKPLAGGLDYRPTKSSAGAYSYSMTIPQQIPVGSYKLMLYRYDGQSHDLGTISVHSQVVISKLKGDEKTSLEGGVELLADERGASQFCPGDSIMLVDKATSEVYKVAASVDHRSPFRMSYKAPEEYLGDAKTYLLRGATVSYLQDLEILDIKVGDYYEGGVIIWFDTQKALSGICMNVFNGATTQRTDNGDLKRLPMGTEYHAGQSNGTERVETQAIGRGDVNTKKFHDYEIKRGFDPSAIHHRDYNGTNPLPSIPYLAMNYKLEGRDGKIYGDWFVPAFETLRKMLYMRDELNHICDSLGGEPLPGSKYVYEFEPFVGKNCWGYGDGMSTTSSNVDNDPNQYYNMRLIQFRQTPAEEAGGEFVESDHLASYMIQAPDFAFRLVRKFGYEKK